MSKTARIGIVDATISCEKIETTKPDSEYHAPGAYRGRTFVPGAVLVHGRFHVLEGVVVEGDTIEAAAIQWPVGVPRAVCGEIGAVHIKTLHGECGTWEPVNPCSALTIDGLNPADLRTL